MLIVLLCGLTGFLAVRKARGENLVWQIDPAKCTECVGSFDESQCAAVCPVDSCVPDPDHVESKDQLAAKHKALKG